MVVEHTARAETSIVHDAGAAHEFLLTEAVYAILLPRARRGQCGRRPRDPDALRHRRGRALPVAHRVGPGRRPLAAGRGVDARAAGLDFPVLRSFGEDVPEFTQERAFEYGLDLILNAIPR